VNATDFFEQNTILFFNINFDAVSLIELVDFKDVKKYLIESQQALHLGNNEICIENSAIAFSHLLYTYEDNKIGGYVNSPFHFGGDLTFSSSHYMIFKNDKKMAHFIDTVKDSIQKIQLAIKITSFGIDYKKYAKFKLLTPNVTRTLGGLYVAELWNTKKWTKDNCQYCIDFVIDSCLKLQEFDFDIKDIEEDDELSVLELN
jgi:hypothetical protein